MDTESLKIFCTVAAELSITQAALRLGRAPSNVSTRIQQLEAELDATLLVRSGRRIALSPAGERLLDYAQRLLALHEQARQAVNASQAGAVLRLGSMESCAASRLPALLARYHALYPDTQLQLRTGPSRQLLEQLCRGQLDAAFVALPPGDAHTLADLGLSGRRMWREALRLLLPASLAQVRRVADVPLRSLAAFAPGCTYRSMAEALLGVAGSSDWQVHEIGSYHAMLACICAGSSVALMPASVLALTQAPAELKSLPAGHADTLLVWRTHEQSLALQEWLTLLKQRGAAAH
ncbi:LysR substrate-binding domain-containing protein [Vandammella animalimorsus]|uniref:LysR substrate-binding domain-containing protein n=1 Tax=Vandammella animalimorsus TaxID=2029117 RepID=UPI00325B6E31